MLLPDDLICAIAQFFPVLEQRIILRQINRAWRGSISTGCPVPGTCSGLHSSLYTLHQCQCVGKQQLMAYSHSLGSALPIRLVERVELVQATLWNFTGEWRYPNELSEIRAVVQGRQGYLPWNSLELTCLFVSLLTKATRDDIHVCGSRIQLKLLMMIYTRFGLYHTVPASTDWYRMYTDAVDWLVTKKNFPDISLV
jgi:hypothetical protein